MDRENWSSSSYHGACSSHRAASWISLVEEVAAYSSYMGFLPGRAFSGHIIEL